MNRFACFALALCVGHGLVAADDAEPPYDLEREELKNETPPFKLERPSDSWVFLKLDVLKENAQDPTGFETLKAQLWWGAAKASIYVRAWPDNVHRREPPTSDTFAEGQIAHVQRVLGQEAKLKKRGRAKVGKRAATVFEVEGQNTKGEAWLVQQAVIYRPADIHIFVLSLEGPAERTKDLRKQFKKLLKKVRL